jgi:hypothetical protein
LRQTSEVVYLIDRSRLGTGEARLAVFDAGRRPAQSGERGRRTTIPRGTGLGPVLRRSLYRSTVSDLPTARCHI